MVLGRPHQQVQCGNGEAECWHGVNGSPNQAGAKLLFAGNRRTEGFLVVKLSRTAGLPQSCAWTGR